MFASGIVRCLPLWPIRVWFHGLSVNYMHGLEVCRIHMHGDEVLACLVVFWFSVSLIPLTVIG